MRLVVASCCQTKPPAPIASDRSCGHHEGREPATPARRSVRGRLRHHRRQRPDGGDVGEHPLAQRGGRLGGGGLGEQRGGLAQRVDLAAAGVAVAQVPLELGALDVVEGVDRVGAREGVDVAHAPTPIVSRSRIRPSRMRVLAVPTGRSSIVATSVCV